MQKRLRIGIIIFIIITIAISFGVSHFARRAIKDTAINMSTKNEVESNEWGGESYSSFGLDAKLPENFPEDIYVLEGSTLHSCSLDTNQNNEVVQANVVGNSDDTLEEAFKKYQEKYKGYDEYEESKNGSKNRATTSYSLEFKKGEIEYRVKLSRDSNDDHLSFNIDMSDQAKY